jgi:prolyl oligopeptidase
LIDVSEDPFEYLEDLRNLDVVSWALSESRRCVEGLKEVSDRVFDIALRYYSIPVLYSFSRNRVGLFFLRRDLAYSVNLAREGSTEVLVDSRKLGEDAAIHSYYIDREGRLFAYFYTLRGSDVGELVVAELDTLSVVDRVSGSISDVVFLDGGRYYYVKFFREGRCPDGVEAPCERVFLRDGGRDKVVFGEGLPRSHFISLTTSTDYSHALLRVSYGWARDTLYAGPLGSPDRWVKVYEGGYRSRLVDYVGGSYLAVLYDGERFGRLVKVGGGVAELVPERGEYLQDAAVVGDYILASYIRHASSYLAVFDLGGRPVREVTFDEPTSVVRLSSYGSGGFVELRYFTKPYEVLEVSAAGGPSFRKVSEHPRVVDAEVTEGFVESYDGTKVHYFWVRRRAGSSRVVVYGYGGFSVALTPLFAPWIPVFIEVGYDVVVANLRGGSEYGERWHEAGMRDRKVNVFYDYIAVARRFKSAGYRVVGLGRSNGGLLIGAVVTMEPDLLDVAAIGYPVLDMLRFHKLYIGAAWIPEYGNPDDPRDREYLVKYSPYHNIREGVRYPPTILYTGLYDDRVHPAHALKFYAKLRSYGNEACLRLETSSGHASSSPVVIAREVADVVAFIELSLSRST